MINKLIILVLLLFMIIQILLIIKEIKILITSMISININDKQEDQDGPKSLALGTAEVTIDVMRPCS